MATSSPRCASWKRHVVPKLPFPNSRLYKYGLPPHTHTHTRTHIQAKSTLLQLYTSFRTHRLLSYPYFMLSHSVSLSLHIVFMSVIIASEGHISSLSLSLPLSASFSFLRQPYLSPSKLIPLCCCCSIVTRSNAYVPSSTESSFLIYTYTHKYTIQPTHTLSRSLYITAELNRHTAPSELLKIQQEREKELLKIQQHIEDLFKIQQEREREREREKRTDEQKEERTDGRNWGKGGKEGGEGDLVGEGVWMSFGIGRDWRKRLGGGRGIESGEEGRRK